MLEDIRRGDKVVREEVRIPIRRLLQHERKEIIIVFLTKLVVAALNYRFHPKSSRKMPNYCLSISFTKVLMNLILKYVITN